MLTTPLPIRERIAPAPVESRPSQLDRWQIWLHAVLMATAAGAGLVVVVRYAIYSTTGFARDQRLMESLGVTSAGWSRLMDVLGLVTDAGVAIALLACVVVAMAQRRWAVAAAAGVLIAGANLTTQVLKHHVLQSVAQQNSLPSGHTTVGLSLALAAVVVAPYRWRPLVTAGAAALATFIGAGTVAAHWHRPGDVLAAGMVCLGWAAVALAIAGGLQRRRHRGRQAHALWLASVAGVVFAGVVFVAIGVRPSFGFHDLPRAIFALGLMGAMFGIVVAWVSSAVDRWVA
ncbi:phosphatase PAP2 family protein [Flexivirga caeni]|uniref:Phosphatase PAP2 family protein n=1 Tax=Flexivirga caeni TaxID=2294115 RepID=A0A3M9MAL9_9MICO|nr:phosphatase PAP2 family protein [Flexivirga caeni]RNI22217.1 phosphatase PAP2 family protein [Flexivirga caeni]